jgi:peptide/nickel transport system permease protein
LTMSIFQQLLGVLRQLLGNPLSAAGLLILFFFFLVALFAPVLAPPPPDRDPYLIPRDGFRTTPGSPSAEHPFGTAQGQYDIYYGVVWGTRTAFRIGIIVVGFGVLIGIVVGGVSGFYGGLIDELLMRITDIFISFPFLIAAMVMTTILGKGLVNMIIALIIFGWMENARLFRGEVLRIKQRDYVVAARAYGATDLRLMRKHILPNAIFPIFVTASIAIGTVVFTAAALSFLGVGTEVGYADWGQMISFSRSWIIGQSDNPFEFWYTVIFPGMAIFLFMLAWTFIGDGLRDIMDPRLRSRR